MLFGLASSTYNNLASKPARSDAGGVTTTPKARDHTQDGGKQNIVQNGSEDDTELETVQGGSEDDTELDVVQGASADV